jgi:hypothetical protein
MMRRRTKTALMLTALLLSVTASAFGQTDGRLIVKVTDNLGNPITTNLQVVVRVLEKSGFMAGDCPSDFGVQHVNPDSNGIVRASFKLLEPRFHWTVAAPGYHVNAMTFQRESLDAEVAESEYLRIDESTEDGKRMAAELKTLEDAKDFEGLFAKYEPQSVVIRENTIYRSVSFYPKRNPQPMYAFQNRRGLPLCVDRTAMTNGTTVVFTYPQMEYDIKERALLPPYGNGQVSDFKIVHMCTVSNDVPTHHGWLEFGPGCGAYKGRQTGDESFPSTYSADTNAIYASRIAFSYHPEGDRWVTTVAISRKDEYLVLRTRAKVDANGRVTECNYSKMLGEIYVGARLGFQESVFNPRVNEPNLEFDTENNLSDRRFNDIHP